jgi:hypothetical protein
MCPVDRVLFLCTEIRAFSCQHGFVCQHDPLCQQDLTCEHDLGAYSQGHSHVNMFISCVQDNLPCRQVPTSVYRHTCVLTQLALVNMRVHVNVALAVNRNF